jgi:hypothetical protein
MSLKKVEPEASETPETFEKPEEEATKLMKLKKEEPEITDV